MNKPLLVFRIFAVAVSLFGMAYRLIIGPVLGEGWPQLLDTLGYFTIQAALLVLFVFLSLLINQLKSTPDKAVSPKVRGAALLYIIAASILFLVLFDQNMNETGISRFVLYINNFVVAILLLIDNSVSIPAGTHTWALLPVWLIYPFVYLFFCIFESLVFDYYRYYIFDFSEYGLGFFVQVLVLLLLIFSAIGGFIIFINKIYKNASKEHEMA